MSCMTVVAKMAMDGVASLQCRDGARRVFTDQVGVAFTKVEAP